MSRRKAPPRPVHQLNVAIPGLIWRRLAVAANVLGRPQAAIVTDALQQYFETLPADARRLIDLTITLRDKT